DRGHIELGVCLVVEPEQQMVVDVGAGLRAVLVRNPDDEVDPALPVEVRAHVGELVGGQLLGRRVQRAAHQLFPLPWPMLSTARNASCGTSTAPTCFIRFLPFFWFSSSF